MTTTEMIRHALSVAAALACLAATPATGQTDGSTAEPEAATLTTGGACGQSAQAALRACRLQAQSDRSLAIGTCTNLSDAGDRSPCLHRADTAFDEALSLCHAQLKGRQELCEALGSGPYDPAIRPADFTSRIDNAYLPLVPGTLFVYRSPHGLVNFEVTHKTRKIAGVTCVVVHDVGYIDGKLEEDTYDYFAQDKAGNVWYFGEDTAQYANGVVVGVEGAWATGVDGAKPGIVMPASPKVGSTYRQEFLLGTAEDAARVRSLSDPVTVPYGKFNKSLRTREFSPLEPGAVEDKYYVKGVGQVLTIDLTNGEREALVGIEHH
jgi:hypothetical protein